jgi:RNA polymerase primary sigma factor
MMNAQSTLKDAYFRDMHRATTYPLTREEERALTGNSGRLTRKAKEQLIIANLPFAVSIAMQYSFCGIEDEDLIQFANIGLCRAAETFDSTKGFKFITYAVWWIRQAILKAIAETGIIRYPQNVIKDAQTLRNYHRKYEIMHGEAAELSTLRDFINAHEPDIWSQKRTETAHVAFLTYFSANSSRYLHDDNPAEFVDSVDSDAPTPDDDLRDTLIHEEIVAALTRLDKRSRDVIARYYGLDKKGPQTLQVIGDAYGFSKERARQVVSAAMEDLRRYAKGVQRRTGEALPV